MLKKLYAKARKMLTRNEEGATMVEYGLMIALIAVVCIAAVTLLGTSISSMFSSVSTNVNTASS